MSKSTEYDVLPPSEPPLSEGSGSPLNSSIPLPPEERRLGYLLLEAASRHLLGPLLGRFGHMDQSIAWLKGASLWWNDRYKHELPVGRWVLNFELGRDYTWSYRNQEKMENGEPIDEGAARLTYRARNTLLDFLTTNRSKSFTSADICRKFHKQLSFIPRSEFESLLNMYVAKQYLLKEGNRFRIRESYTPVKTTERPQREEKLKRWYETVGPLSQSFLEGRGQLVGFHASLPMPLWEEFQKRQAEFIRATIQELVAKGNSPEYQGSHEFEGGGFLLNGPYPWTLPHWKELQKAANFPAQTEEEAHDAPASRR